MMGISNEKREMETFEKKIKKPALLLLLRAFLFSLSALLTALSSLLGDLGMT